ncbi:winged helix-turn-helix domain-containing protein [Streptomyces sp. SPB074]|uniref:winged helix-turn-helix domain-containing protein n=1 Tax=Streptomyces sp. (strain SPB074) TaxID=465543 RepID=UPI0001D1E09A|nr:GntR-family transcriptional regulator [Streptomyces sp. SPB074]
MADELRTRIRTGVLRPGDRMPTQARLATEFGVERGTVREALRILRAEHLLTHATRGAPPAVADPPARGPGGPGEVPRSTTAALGPRIAAAFEQPHVEIRALCLTSVSLTLAMGEPLRQIHAGELKPDRIDLRVLLPDRDIGLAFPAPVERTAPAGPAAARGAGPAAQEPGSGAYGPGSTAYGAGPAAREAVHRHWLAQRNAQGRVLAHNLLALRSSHGMDVHVEYRAIPFTPPVKLYLLNEEEALFAYYTLARRGADYGSTHVETFDAEGTEAVLFAFGQDGGPRDAAFVGQSAAWFDGLWNTISAPLRLT